MASFFSGLQLWEKMILILGCVIGTVFCVGVGKLWWSGRRARMQFIIDEEKRDVMQKTKEADLVVESQQMNQVPFGVRAIESGIEIDGIWISRSTTPVPEGLTIPRVEDQMSNSSIITNSASTVRSLPSDTSQPGASCIRNILTVERQHSQFEPTISMESFHRPASPKSFEQRLAYKPKRSSQLRFSSYGDFHYHEETLNRLEGRPSTHSKPAARLSGSTGRTLGFYAIDSSSDMVNDNDRSSGSSSETDGTFSSNGIPVKRDSRRHWPIYAKTTEESAIQARANASESMAMIIPANDSEYLSAQKENSTQDKTTTENFIFATPNLSPGAGHSSVSEEDPSPMSESQVPLLSRAGPPSPKNSIYERGGFHMNKAVRKVNSNFEVLPAGTFGTRLELIAMAAGEPGSIGPEVGREPSINQSSLAANARQSRKLQKKAPRPWIKSRVFGRMGHI